MGLVDCECLVVAIMSNLSFESDIVCVMSSLKEFCQRSLYLKSEVILDLDRIGKKTIGYDVLI